MIRSGFRIVFVASVGAALAGCAIGLTPDGRPVAGLVVGEDGQLQIPNPTYDGFAAFAHSLGIPGSAGLVGGLMGLAGMLGRSAGRHKGWDERQAQADREAAALEAAKRGGGYESRSSLSSRAGGL